MKKVFHILTRLRSIKLWIFLIFIVFLFLSFSLLSSISFFLLFFNIYVEFSHFKNSIHVSFFVFLTFVMSFTNLFSQYMLLILWNYIMLAKWINLILFHCHLPVLFGLSCFLFLFFLFRHFYASFTNLSSPFYLHLRYVLATPQLSSMIRVVEHVPN